MCIKLCLRPERNGSFGLSIGGHTPSKQDRKAFVNAVDATGCDFHVINYEMEPVAQVVVGYFGMLATAERLFAL
jgi:hypothetical protein